MGESEADRGPPGAAGVGRLEVVIEKEVQDVGRQEHAGGEEDRDERGVDRVGDEPRERPGRVVGEWKVNIKGPRTIEHPAVGAVAAEITLRLREEIASHARP